MGFANERLFPSKFTLKHFPLDLNDCAAMPVKGSDAEFDLIVFSETIEHLYTAPSIVLPFLSKFLLKKPGSGILIQTPNAVSFSKRFHLLLGKNPYNLIREDRTSPGHFREYTVNELKKYAEDAGFSVRFCETCSYWTQGNVLKRMVNLYPPLREGITIFLVKQ